MRKSGFIVLTIVFAAFFSLGCDLDLSEKMKEERIENIVRVFMHEPPDHNNGRFSFLVAGSENELRLQTVSFVTEVRFVSDVPPEQSMWATRRFNVYRTEYLEIHLHRVQDVEGGNWNHGKNGSGATHVIQ